MTITEAERQALHTAALPLMTWLAEHAHPHMIALVDGETVEVMEGLAVARRQSVRQPEEA